MRFLIAEVPEEYKGNSEYFTAGDKEYYYEIKFDPTSEGNDVVISDTCGRAIPLGIEELAEISSVLKRIVRYNDDKKLTDQWLLQNLLA